MIACRTYSYFLYDSHLTYLPMEQTTVTDSRKHKTGSIYSMTSCKLAAHACCTRNHNSKPGKPDSQTTRQIIREATQHQSTKTVILSPLNRTIKPPCRT